jgi:hypothetical protein
MAVDARYRDKDGENIGWQTADKLRQGICTGLC